MDLHAVIGQFFDEQGQITLPPQMNLAGLCETLYQAEAMQGGGDRHCMRFWDFSSDRDGVAVDYTRAQINTRIKAVAARLQQVGTIGDRVAVLAGNSPEYLFGFIGAMYAGMVPVPLYDPNEPGHADHLQAVLGDCKPKIVLTHTPAAASVRAHFAEVPAAERPRIISVDSLPDSLAESWVNPLTLPEVQAMLAQSTQAPLDMVAFLQYTSGSTRVPAGVVLTHRSVMTNVLQIFTAARLQTPLRLVTWLPLHHDMGIILAAFVTILGLEMEFMTPRDFIQQPSRWTKQLSKRDNDVNVYTVVPNFALELGVRYGQPAEGEELDLSALDGLIVGSEPVTAKAVNQFFDVFSRYGLERGMIRPSYGLAEASLLVSTPQADKRPLIIYADREKLSEGVVEVVEENQDNAVPLMSNGSVVQPQALVVVDPETRTELADGQIGEFWAHGQNMALGYLDRPEETAATFHNTLIARLHENSRAAGFPDDDRWMATGDLGAIIDNEVYITGRLKDLIVVAGRNHYPQDIEYTVDHATDHIEPAAIAAFAIEGDDVEKLVIFAERERTRDESGDAAAIEAIRAAVTKNHGVVPHDIRIVGLGEIPRSSSGKIARRVCKNAYLAEG